MICLLPVGHDDPAAGDYFGCPRCERLERPMTALPLWRPELSLESCPVEETEDSQAPSNQTQAAPIPKWQTCYFPPPSITSTSSLASRSATSCPRAPSSPGLNPPIKSYLTNLPPTKISPRPLHKRGNAQLMIGHSSLQISPPRQKPTSISSWAICWRQTQSWDNSLDFFRPQSRFAFPALISQTHHMKHAPSK